MDGSKGMDPSNSLLDECPPDWSVQSGQPEADMRIKPAGFDICACREHLLRGITACDYIVLPLK